MVQYDMQYNFTTSFQYKGTVPAALQKKEFEKENRGKKKI